MDNALKKRRGLKGKITRLETILGASGIPPPDVRLVERYQQQMRQHWTELNDVHEDIGLHCDDAEFAAHQVEFDLLAARIEALEVRLPTRASEGDGGERLAAPSSATNHGTVVRLPKLELPTFSGDLQQWTSFYDLFTATIQRNEQLSGAQKLQYLKAALRGEAAQVLQSLQITDNNFPVAWEILTKRYHNRREIINAHLTRLCTQPILASESPVALRKLIDNTNETVRALSALDVPVNHWDLILVHIVSQRLDYDSRRQWELTLHTTNEASYSEFMEFLEVRARALLACSAPPTSKHHSTSQPKVTSRDWRPPSQASYHADTSMQECAICKEPHSIYNCNEFLHCDVAARRSLVKDHGLCYNCLSNSHSWRRCKAGVCKNCGGNHHTLLHNLSTPTSSNENVSHVSTHHGRLKDNVEQPEQVLLATALVRVRDAHGNQQVCRALLDSGSQATFVSDACAQRLGLPRQRASVSVSGINASKVKEVRGSVDLRVSSRVQKNEELYLNAFILERVTTAMPAMTSDRTNWTHLPTHQLADPEYHRPNQIDLLLGADVLGAILRKGLRRGPKGTPIAQNTSFGWLVSGKTGQGFPSSMVSGNIVVTTRERQGSALSHHLRNV